MRNLSDPKYVDGDFLAAVTAAGTTQGTATTLKSNHSLVTVVADGATGVILKAYPPGEVFSVANGDAAQSLLVYPPSGAAFNGQTANDPITLPVGFCAMGRVISNTVILVTF